MVVEVVEEEAGVTGALGVLLATTAGAPSVGVTEDGSSDEGIGSHVAQAEVLHQPDNDSSVSVSLTVFIVIVRT